MVDTTDATFERDVVERSRQVPVVVDLWAPWCGPCRQLGPILEDVVGATGGAVELVKVNVDENPETSAAFRVQGIPAVFGFRDARVVDHFVGARGRDAVQAFVDGLLPTAEEAERDALLAAGDEASLRRALELAPGDEAVVLALAEVLLDGDGSGRADGEDAGDEVLALLERIPESAATRRLAARARTGGAGDDLDGRLDALLDRAPSDDDARRELLDLLEVMGPDDARTATYRKALTSRLF